MQCVWTALEIWQELQLFFSLQENTSNKKKPFTFFKKNIFKERDLKVNYKRK